MKSINSLYCSDPDFYFPDNVVASVIACYDRETQVEVSSINKNIRELIFCKLAEDLKLPPEKVMKYFKMHCKHFNKRLALFPKEHIDTITNIKKVIDERLNCKSIIKNNRPTCPLDFLCTQFLNQTVPSSNPNQEIQLFIRAGARPNLESIIKKEWCTAETVGFLVDYGFTVDLECFIAACNNQFYTSLPGLIQCLQRKYRYPLRTLFQQVPELPAHIKQHLRDYFEKVYKNPSSDDIRVLIEQKFPEKIVGKMVDRLSYQLDSPRWDRIVEDANEKNFSSLQFFDSVLKKVKEDEVPQCLETILVAGISPEIMTPFLVDPGRLIFPQTITNLMKLYISEKFLSKIIDHIEVVSPEELALARSKVYSADLLTKMGAKVRG